MREVAIIGIGQTPVGEHWEKGLRELALEALEAAIRDAGVERLDALYIGNMLSGQVESQEHLGALVADFAGMHGVEAVKVEAACASGAAALRIGYAMVAGGLADFVAVVGVEKMTDASGEAITAALATAADAEYEAVHGMTFTALNALLMRRYMHEYGYRREDFAPFSINAHRNAVHNPCAMLRFPITAEAFASARMIADPITLLDASPVCDGAAAVILCPADQARAFQERPVRIRASAVATDTVALHDRRDPLWLEAVALSAYRAFQQAGVRPEDVDFFELHDAFTIMAALSLEASGFAPRGRGVAMALEGAIFRDGRLPIATMGGLKARGHPVGATGIYQVVEAVLQLRGQAGPNQIPNARLGMTQNIGGTGATVITHILEAMD